ncbi:MAG TPA: ATPase, partial [Planctomycetota bacterium]|nr:ATPase [Planctomycetota bacterium]
MSIAIVSWIAGPVLHAVRQGPFVLRESVRVGPQALLGEVVRIGEREIVVQVYEDTSGLRPGSEVRGDGAPLSIRVGPGLLGRIFDGLLRPLSDTGSAYVQPGLRSGAAGRWRFEPAVAVGALVGPGAVIGTASADGRSQRCLAPPDAAGVVVSIVAPGEHDEEATVCVL